jgi:hypothetical protein
MMSSRKKTNWLYSIIIGSLSGVVIFIACFLITTYYFGSISIVRTLSYQIDPLNLLSILVNAGLVWYVAKVLDQRNEENRVERDLLIKYLTDFESTFLDEIHKVASGDGIEGTILASTFKKNAMLMDELVELGKSVGDINLNGIKDSVSEIRELLTTTPKTDEVEDGVRVHDGKLFYSTKHINQVSITLGKFKTAVFSAIAKINRNSK